MKASSMPYETKILIILIENLTATCSATDAVPSALTGLEAHSEPHARLRETKVYLIGNRIGA